MIAFGMFERAFGELANTLATDVLARSSVLWNVAFACLLYDCYFGVFEQAFGAQTPCAVDAVGTHGSHVLRRLLALFVLGWV